MIVDDITVETFLERLRNGEKRFEAVDIEDFNFVLENYNLDQVQFRNSFVNINFKNCSLKNSIFSGCNLKSITFENCDITECKIEECSIESLEMKACNMDGLMFDTEKISFDTWKEAAQLKKDFMN